MTTPMMHMDCDGFAGSLADYLECDLPNPARAALDAHANTCASCAALLEDINHIREHAAALPALEPSRDLWAGIASRIDTPVIALDTSRTTQAAIRRQRWFIPALAAAALVGVTATITYHIARIPATMPVPAVASVRSNGVASPDTAASEPAPAVARLAVAPLTMTSRSGGGRVGNEIKLVSAQPTMVAIEPVFTNEIGKLRKILNERRRELDPATVLVLERSVKIIDSAIAQSRAALAKDPASGFLAAQLNRSLETKVELLRTAASLPART